MLLSDVRTLYNWLYENFLIFNPTKCDFMSIGKDTHDEGVFYKDKLTLKNRNEKEILGVTIDRKFTFHQLAKKMCRKAGQKFSTLMRLCIPSYEEKESNIHYQSQISN